MRSVFLHIGKAGWLPLLLVCGFFLSPAYGKTMLNFDELYGKISVLGLEFSDKVKNLSGKKVRIQGFMAPPLKADSQFFVLTKMPMALCPFCSSDADWPPDILVVYLRKNKVLCNSIKSFKSKAS